MVIEFCTKNDNISQRSRRGHSIGLCKLDAIELDLMKHGLKSCMEE